MSVTVQVVPRGVLRMLGRMHMVRMGQVGVMSRLVVVAGLVVAGGFGVVMRGHAVMVGRLAMFVHCLL